MDMEELRINKRDKLLDDNCEVCIKAKQVKKQGHVPVPKARRPLQRVYMDFWGPNREGAGPERYFLSLIDDCTRYSWLFIKTDRRTESVIYTLDVWSRQVERQAGQMLLIIRTDNAAEFIALKPWAKSKGIELEFIESYTPPQNGVAERFNRVILDIARALLFDAKISKIYWKYAVITANYLRNRITQLRDSAEDEDGEDRTPYELWHGHKPDLTHLRAWGCRVLFHTQADSKLDSRVAEGTFMMYGKSDKQYFVLPRGGQELRLVTNAEFREQESGYCLKPFQQLQQPDRPLPPAQQEAPAQEHQPNPMPIEIPAEREAREKEPTERPSYRQTTVSDSNEEGPAPERPDTGSMTDKPSELLEVEKNGETPWDGETSSPHGSVMDKPRKPSEVDKHGEIPKVGKTSSPHGMADKPFNLPEVKLEGERRDDEVHLGRRDNKLRGVAPPEAEEAQQPREGEVNVPPTETTSPDVRRSARIRQPSKMMMESYQQQQESREQRGAKRRTEGEDGLDNRPAQRLRARLAQKENARMALATELLIGDCEFEVTEKARPALEKNGIRIPRTYKEAVNDPIYGSKWKEAIHKELIALMSFGTWRVIPRKEAEGTISSTRWVFDVKIGLDGRIDRFKARLVARGNEQSDNDFDETFAPVFRLDSLRILVAMAARYGLVAHVLDASNAFVGSDLDKPNCMEIPEGLQDFDPEAGQGGMVLELTKSLYGLRQSANLWHRKISQFLKKIGFKPITADPSVFINGRGLIIGLYVDDIIIFGKHEHGIEAVKQKLKEFHPMTDSGRVQKLLGIRFTWGRDRSIRLDQESYTRQILEEFGMADCKAVSSPLSPSVQLDSSDSPRLGQGDHKLFRRLIGRLMFLVTATRPDIAFAINQLSQYLAEPGQVHLGAAKHVLRYVKGTIDYGLVYGAKGRCQQGLIAYSDSAYANSKENRSTTGFIFMIDAAPIVWSSRKQSLTAQSSTEAEYIAASEAGAIAYFRKCTVSHQSLLTTS
jgi:transposase InsO family protein